MTLLFYLELDFSTEKIISGWPLASGYSTHHFAACILNDMKSHQPIPTPGALLTEF